LCWSIGFGLSVAATAGLALLSGPIERRLRLPHSVRWLRAPLAATLAAQIGTFPLLVGLGGVSPVSIVANLLALPAAEPVMVWGVIIGVPAGLLGQPASSLLHAPDRLLMWWIANVARICAAIVRRHPVQWWWPTAVALLCLLVFALRQGRSWPPPRLTRWMILPVVALVGFALSPRTTPLGGESLGRSRTAMWREGSSVAMLLRPSTDPNRSLADLRSLRITALHLVVVEKSTNQTWSSVGPILARFRVSLLVQCGINSTMNGREVIGLQDGDQLRVAHQKRSWLVVTCERGKASVTTDDPLHR
jgi:Competence protein